MTAEGDSGKDRTASSGTTGLKIPEAEAGEAGPGEEAEDGTSLAAQGAHVRGVVGTSAAEDTAAESPDGEALAAKTTDAGITADTATAGARITRVGRGTTSRIPTRLCWVVGMTTRGSRSRARHTAYYHRRRTRSSCIGIRNRQPQCSPRSRLKRKARRHRRRTVRHRRRAMKLKEGVVAV